MGIGTKNDVSTTTAVAPIGTTTRDVLLTAKGDASVTPSTTDYPQVTFIDESDWHGPRRNSE
jgi:hypothetical protein